MIGEAAVQFSQPPILDFTGLVEIFGACSGFVYVTFPQRMLAEMLALMGEHEATHATCMDFSGEIANTIASNARESFGSTFGVSTPTSYGADATERLTWLHTSFVLPITWHASEAWIVIALKQN